MTVTRTAWLMRRPGRRDAASANGNDAVAGMTLVEVIVVAVLVSIIMVALVTSFMTGRTTFFSSDASSLIQQQARQAYDNAVRELRESATISCGEAATIATCTNSRVNFQIVRSYNAATDTVELGSEVAANEFLHYIITAAGTNAKLVRCRSAAATTATATFGDFSGCRVLANYVNGAPASSGLTWDTATRTVTLNLEIDYRSNLIPSGGQTTGRLTSRVRLRNPA